MLVGTQKTLQCPIITTIDSQGEAILRLTTEVMKSFLSPLSALEMYVMYGMNKLSSPAITL